MSYRVVWSDANSEPTDIDADLVRDAGHEGLWLEFVKSGEVVARVKAEAVKAVLQQPAE